MGDGRPEINCTTITADFNLDVFKLIPSSSPSQFVSILPSPISLQLVPDSVQPGCISTEYHRLLRGGQRQRVDARLHLRNAADEVRIVATRQQLRRSRKLEREAQRLRVEVHRIVVELLEVVAG